MPSDSSFEDLMAQLKIGDNNAANKVFHRFARQLVGLARQQLDTQIRQKVDPEDVTQSVFRSFFAHQAAGELVDLETWDSLWAMLVVMTLRKCRRQNAFFYADRRDVHREITFMPLPDESGAGWEPCDREPTPVETAALSETVEELLQHFAGRPRQILTLFLQGYKAPEISSRLGCTERTVYRTYERVKEWLRSHGRE